MAEYDFNFPPITALTIPQQAALNCTEAIALSGGPGTGKSFISLWRHIPNHNRDTPVRSLLLTFTRSLAYYLKINSQSENLNAGEWVDTFQHWYPHNTHYCDEIIVDEAQDIPLCNFKDPDKLQRFSDKISYGADNKQILEPKAIVKDAKTEKERYNYDHCSPAEELAAILKNKPFVLDENFRNTRCILNFAKKKLFRKFIYQKMKLNLVRKKELNPG